MHYIDVVIDNKSINTDNFFTYLAPDEVGVGAKVSVQFAKRKKPVEAYCVAENIEPSFDKSKIKEIISYNTERSLNHEMIETSMWMRKRYGIKYIDAIKMFTVGGKRVPKPKVHTKKSYKSEKPILTDEQKSATEKILAAIENKINKSFLIKGVTNSGKTEVYMRAVEKALLQGRTAIILLPEIALSSQVEKRFVDRFGRETVATIHSKLTTSKKLEEWLRIKNGEAKIVVGARTSIFAPLDNIGVIVIDEEHEGTYKSDHNPKFETVDIAYKRALMHNAVMIIGSATPDVVSYYRAKMGVYDLIEMNERVGTSLMPDIEVIDMRSEIRSGNLGLISIRLAEEIDNALKREEQVILFLNRRGFSTQILCPDCGHRMMCDECNIPLTYHKSINASVCHYCGKKYPLPDVCPECNSKFIKYSGAGTEKVEEEVNKLWEKAGVSRFDTDTASSNDDIEKIINDFKDGKTDILIGTQILAKGLDFKNVGLVGIINADTGLNIPDYRSQEKTFQLITQVAGRAGRTSGKSLVLIQTYDPDSEVIKYAANRDYESFYESELLHRSIMNYPPFTDIIAVSCVSESSEVSMKYAKLFREKLINIKNAPEDAVILNPREEDVKTDGKKRVTFIIKAPPGSRMGYVGAYMNFRDQLNSSKAKCYIEIDVNPYGIT